MRVSISLRAGLVLSVFSAVIAAGAGSAHAVTVIYEGFDYASGGYLSGQNGGIGFAGPWQYTRTNPVIRTGSLTWGDLVVSGNYVQNLSTGGIYRPIGTALADAGLMADGETLWFSYVEDCLAQNMTNLDFNFALGTDRFVAGTSALEYPQRMNFVNNGSGIGVSNSTTRVQGAYWLDDGDGDGYGEVHATNTPLILNNTTNSRALIVGKIVWGANASAGEKITLYAPGADLVLGTPILDAWTTPALDQSQFDTLAIEWKDTPSIDEIRFGHTYDDVITFPTAYWDLNGTDPNACTGGGNTAAGTWDAATATWNLLSDGTGSTSSWTPGSVAAFAAGSDATGSYTVTVSGTRDMGGLSFYQGSVTLAPADENAALRMTRDTPVFVASGLTATIATAITDNGTAWQLTKIGTGMLAISGSGTLGSGGNVTVSGGSVDLGGTSQTVGELSITVAALSGDTISHGSLTATSYAASNASGTAVVSANLLDSSASTMTKSGAGILVLSGTNTYTGATSINAGAIQFNSPAAMGGTGRDVTVNTGGTVVFGPSFGDANIPAALAGRIVNTSAGAIAADNYAGTNFDFNTPGLTGARLGAVGSVTYTGTLTPNGTTYRIGGGGGMLTMTNDSALTGAGNDVVVRGDVVLSGANNYEGTTTLQAGILQANNATALGSGGDIKFTGGTLQYAAASAGQDWGARIKNSTGAINLDTNNQTVTLAGIIDASNTAGLAKLGEGTLILNGANAYAGVTTVQAGILQAGTPSAFGAAPSLAFGPGSTGTVQLNGNSMTVTGLNTNATVGTPVVENAAAADAVLTVNNSAASTYNGKIQDGAGGGKLGLEKKGSGTLTIGNGANTYTGKTSVLAGTLQVTSPFTIAGVAGPLGAPTGADATIDLYNGTTLQAAWPQASGSSTTDRTINLAGSGAGTVSLKVNDNDTVFTFGTVTATGSGAKTLALSTGWNGNGDREELSFNGTITEGTDPLSLNVTFRTQTASTSFVNLMAGGSFTGPITLTRYNTNPTGYLTIGGRLARVGTTMNYTSTPGSGQLNSGNYAGAISLTTGTILCYNSSANQVLAGQISGAGSLLKLAEGTLALTGTNTYTGTTTVSQGTLLVNADNSAATGTVTVAAAGRLGGQGVIGGAVTVSGTLAPGADIGTLTAGGNVTMAENSTYEWQLGASDADKVVVTGDLTLPAVWTLKLMNDGGTPSGEYNLFTYGGIGSITPPAVDYGETGWTINDVTVKEAYGRVYLSFGVPGDTNNDGVVDAADFITLKRNFNQPGAGVAQGNFTGADGFVDWADLGILMTNMGNGGPAPATTPEPATLGLLAIGALAIVRRRRRS